MSKTVTLREAHRIVERLNAILKDSVKLTRDVKRHDFSHEFTSLNAAVWLHEVQTETSTAISDQAELIRIRSVLRDDILFKNIDCGLTETIAHRKRLIDLLSFWRSIVGAGKNIDRFPTETTVFNMLVEQQDASRSLYSDKTICSVPESVVIKAKETVRHLQQEIDKLGDKIAQLNTTQTITLSEDNVDQLTKFNII